MGVHHHVCITVGADEGKTRALRGDSTGGSAALMAALLAAGLYCMASSLLGAQSPQATADSKTSLAGQQFADSRGGLVLNDASGAPDEYTPTEKLLARLIYAEAAGEHSVPDAMEAVAWTVRNRVESPLFPGTFEEVILQKIGQKNQFRSIGGKLWKEAGNPAVLRGPSLRAYNRALAVARGVLTGTIPDPTRGALYFHSGPPTAWFQGAMQAGRIQATLVLPPPPQAPLFTFYR